MSKETTLQEELDQIIQANSDVESSEEEQDLEESYKTKAQMKDELSDVLSGMNRNDLISTYQNIVATPEESITEPEGEDVVETENVEDDPNADDVVFSAEVAKKVVEGLDTKQLQAAYDDLESDDAKDAMETEGDDEYAEQYKNIISAVAKAIKENVKGATSKKATLAARRFCESNKKTITKLTKEATSEKKVVKSSFDPTITFEDNSEEVNEDVDALLGGEDLSEEFRTKAGVIFESAVSAKVNSAVEQLKEQFSDQLNIAISDHEAEMVTNLDQYLNYISEEWMEENRLELDKGIRTELTEDFMLGLKTLFEDHYIEVPDAKVDVFDELASRVEDLEEKLNTEIDKNIQLQEKLSDHEKREIVQEAIADLSEVQKEKLQGLVEDISFSDAEELKSKIQVIKEGYFKNKKKEVKEESAPEFKGDPSDRMSRYTTLLERAGAPQKQ